MIVCHLTESGLVGSAAVVQGTVDKLVTLVENDCRQRASLLLTAPQAGTATCSDGGGTASCIDELVSCIVSAATRCRPLLAPAALIGVICWPARQTDISERLHEAFIDAGFTLADRRAADSTSAGIMLFNPPNIDRSLPQGVNRGEWSDSAR